MSAVIEMDSENVYDEENAHEEERVQGISHNECDNRKPDTYDQYKSISHQVGPTHGQIFLTDGFDRHLLALFRSQNLFSPSPASLGLSTPYAE
jgi:hypothetical protein